jgi:hypothetical protein
MMARSEDSSSYHSIRGQVILRNAPHQNKYLPYLLSPVCPTISQGR